MTDMNNKSDTEMLPLILIVDDIEKNIQFIANILSKQSYRVAFALSGEAALQMQKEILPDLILLDIMMPQMDGIEVCRRLKADPQTRDIPIIFLTAKTETQDLVDGFEAGAADYVTKPFVSKELIARVNAHVELKRARDKQKELIEKLKTALEQIKQLSGLLPICSFCKKIRNDKGYWLQVEQYISQHSEAKFTHSLCPACIKKHYPEIGED